MRKNLQKVLLVLLIGVFSIGASFPKSAEAHDLIPRQLQDYIVQHSNATPEEIKAFADAQDPEYAQKFKNGAEIIAIAQNQQTTPFDTLVDFLKLGVTHILTGPDHILFVLSLLLVFTSITDILKLATLFTVGHSLTLFLSATGILTVSPRISEPLIALSIACVAISTVFFRKSRFVDNKYSKPVSVFFFSLFHGLGFAGLLREIQVPANKFAASVLHYHKSRTAFYIYMQK
jgi:hydrogenase/urease accessory protein HupE